MTRFLYQYRLHYLCNEGDGNQKTYDSEVEITPGMVLRLDTGFWHLVVRSRALQKGVRLDLSKASEGAQDAHLVARQLEHWKEK